MTSNEQDTRSHYLIRHAHIYLYTHTHARTHAHTHTTHTLNFRRNKMDVSEVTFPLADKSSSLWMIPGISSIRSYLLGT